MNAIKDHLSQSGLLNSSFGQQILATTGTAQNQDIAGIPAMDAQNFIRAGAATSTAATGQGIGAMGTAGGLDTMSSGTQTQSAWSALIQGIQLAQSAGNGGKGGVSGASGAGASGGGGKSSSGSGSAIGGLGSSAAAGAMAI